jgi:hypothetical protein
MPKQQAITVAGLLFTKYKIKAKTHAKHKAPNPWFGFAPRPFSQSL